MTRVHDMGGRHGDGPVNPGDDVVFQEDWHGHALALTLAAGALGQWNIDVSRHARERLTPKDYVRFGYYEKWVAALADLLVEKGVLTLEELETGRAQGVSPLAQRCLKAANVAGLLSSGGPADRPTDLEPLFSIGDMVQTRRPARNQKVDGGHTRLPAYAAGVVGRVVKSHGTFVLPDTNAHGLGEQPEPLYAVAFPAAALWGSSEKPGDEVVLDLWQSYLVPV